MEEFAQIVDDMRRHKMKLPQPRFNVCLPNARQVLENAMRYFVSLEGRELEWLPEYEQVADWLSDSGGRGLLLYGSCGRGKSLLIRYAIPAILLKYGGRVVVAYDAQEMNSQLDTVISRPIVALDDIGTEEITVSFGNRRMAFAEVMDAAEKHGKLLLISTNLDGDGIVEKYGTRAMDRIIATTRRVVFEGESLRR